MAGTDDVSTMVGRSRPVSAESWNTYNFEWLFDPDRTDHLSIEDQLELFKSNNLKGTKTYKFATRIWGAPHSRTRVIKATSDDKPVPPQPKVQTKPKTFIEKQGDAHRDLQDAVSKNTQRLVDYHSWMSKRKQFRHQLDTMGLNEGWLQRKPDKTGLEQRVLTRMIQQRTTKPPSPQPPEEPPKSPILPDHPPTIARTCPLAIKIIERFLHKKKLRLIDLFKDVDKNKTWMITEVEFRKAIKNARIPISDMLLDDLVNTLDVDFNNKLDYRELAKGMELWKLEKRETKQQAVAEMMDSNSPEKLSQALGFELPIDEDQPAKSLEMPVKPEPIQPPKSRIKSSSSSASSQQEHLEVPATDMRAEKRAQLLDEDNANKRGRNNVKVLRRISSKKKQKQRSTLSERRMTLIRTGDEEADRHLMPSTLDDHTANMVHKFRQLKYREYNDVCNICQTDNSVQLSEKSLKKVLLYPEDKDHKYLRKNLRQPMMPLLSKASVLAGPSSGAQFY